MISITRVVLVIPFSTNILADIFSDTNVLKSVFNFDFDSYGLNYLKLGNATIMRYFCYYVMYTIVHIKWVLPIRRVKSKGIELRRKW